MTKTFENLKERRLNQFSHDHINLHIIFHYLGFTFIDFVILMKPNHDLNGGEPCFNTCEIFF